MTTLWLRIIAIDELKEIAKQFLDNNGDGSCTYCNGKQLSDASDNPKLAVVSLQNGQQTTYRQYVAVQNELTKAFYELRQAYSLKVLKKSPNDLSETEMEQVKKAYPFILSEAETK